MSDLDPIGRRPVLGGIGAVALGAFFNPPVRGPESHETTTGGGQFHKGTEERAMISVRRATSVLAAARSLTIASVAVPQLF
jgi:hypothetical protein